MTPDGAAALFAWRSARPAQKTGVRLTLGRWLAMGLEFELAADILRTSVARNEIGYCFLEREIRREPEPQPREA